MISTYYLQISLHKKNQNYRTTMLYGQFTLTLHAENFKHLTCWNGEKQINKLNRLVRKLQRSHLVIWGWGWWFPSSPGFWAGHWLVVLTARSGRLEYTR